MPVYILSDHPNNRLKIGYTANLPKRLQTHRTSNLGLEVVAVLEEGDRNAEKAIHRLMQGDGCSGTTEWYRDGAIARQVLARFFLQLTEFLVDI
jgi:T5orf172 domain